MDFPIESSALLRSPSVVDSVNDHFVTTVAEDNETTCWGCGGCGLRLLLPSYAPIFKCGWCGAITNANVDKPEQKYHWWRYLCDRCFVLTLCVFMLFVICGGVWAVYPVVFSISYVCGIFHSIVTIILSITTISTFSLAAFCCAGAPPIIVWGSYPAVAKGDLENYTFCHYCSKPRSPRTHHCHSCGMCILDMDHHCPFIGNCVGAANHRYFVAFLITAIISSIYVSIMSTYAGLYIWPSLPYRSAGHTNGIGRALAFRAVKEVVIALLDSAVLLSARGLVLFYLLVSSASVEIGLSVLLWQQLCYIYEGETYPSHLSSRGGDGGKGKDCKNIFRFFGFSYTILKYFPNSRSALKRT